MTPPPPNNTHTTPPPPPHTHTHTLPPHTHTFTQTDAAKAWARTHPPTHSHHTLFATLVCWVLECRLGVFIDWIGTLQKHNTAELNTYQENCYLTLKTIVKLLYTIQMDRRGYPAIWRNWKKKKMKYKSSEQKEYNYYKSLSWKCNVKI